jgi:hypothetical protein
VTEVEIKLHVTPRGQDITYSALNRALANRSMIGTDITQEIANNAIAAAVMLVLPESEHNTDVTSCWSCWCGKATGGSTTVSKAAPLGRPLRRQGDGSGGERDDEDAGAVYDQPTYPTELTQGPTWRLAGQSVVVAALRMGIVDRLFGDNPRRTFEWKPATMRANDEQYARPKMAPPKSSAGSA